MQIHVYVVSRTIYHLACYHFPAGTPMKPSSGRLYSGTEQRADEDLYRWMQRQQEYTKICNAPMLQAYPSIGHDSLFNTGLSEHSQEDSVSMHRLAVAHSFLQLADAQVRKGDCCRVYVWLCARLLSPIDPSHKSHNASDKYDPTMQHFVTEMCTHVHISATKCCIVGYETGALWDLCNRSIEILQSYSKPLVLSLLTILVLQLENSRKSRSIDSIWKLMAQCNTAVSPLVMHWRYCNFA